jgi:hypothetical protein
VLNQVHDGYVPSAGKAYENFFYSASLPDIFSISTQVPVIVGTRTCSVIQNHVDIISERI